MWSLDSGSCIAQYFGHSGSVNGVSFSPAFIDSSDALMATASGDQTTHIWKANILGSPLVDHSLFFMSKYSNSLIIKNYEFFVANCEIYLLQIRR